MRTVRRSLALALLLALLATSSAPLAWSGPQDSKPGDVRVAFAKKGTALRAEPAALGALVATLPFRAQVTVQEVKLPWIRVTSAQPAATGWMRAYETVEPDQLAATPAPPALTGTGMGVSATEVSAAGRQLTRETEKQYRASRADLERGYVLVDALERETAAIDPADSIDFIVEGDLGRRGSDYKLPPRLPPGDLANDPGKSKPRDPSRAIGSVLGGLKRLGVKVDDDVEKGAKVAGAMAKLFSAFTEQVEKEFSPAQEYYIGRAVAASAYAEYGVDPDTNRRLYVRHVGDAIVRLAGKLRGSFGGYHFDVLNSDEVNGISGPGGFILLTRGAVLACKTEDELAGILAHEIAHVDLRHGEQVIRAGEPMKAHLSRFKAGLGVLGAATGFDDPQVVGQLTTLFAGAVTESVKATRGHAYGRALEQQADRIGAQICYDVFYDWTALARFLKGLPPEAHNPSASHAPPQARAADLEAWLVPLGAFPPREGTLEGRAARFAVALSRRPPPPR